MGNCLASCFLNKESLSTSASNENTNPLSTESKKTKAARVKKFVKRGRSTVATPKVWRRTRNRVAACDNDSARGTSSEGSLQGSTHFLYPVSSSSGSSFNSTSNSRKSHISNSSSSRSSSSSSSSSNSSSRSRSNSCSSSSNSSSSSSSSSRSSNSSNSNSSRSSNSSNSRNRSSSNSSRLETESDSSSYSEYSSQSSYSADSEYEEESRPPSIKIEPGVTQGRLIIVQPCHSFSGTDESASENFTIRKTSSTSDSSSFVSLSEDMVQLDDFSEEESFKVHPYIPK